VIGRDQVWSEDIINAFPRVVSHGITLPLDEVLQGLPPSNTSVVEYCFDLEVFLTFDQVRWRLVKVGAMCFSFSIGVKKQGMEDVVDIP